MFFKYVKIIYQKNKRIIIKIIKVHTYIKSRTWSGVTRKMVTSDTYKISLKTDVITSMVDFGQYRYLKKI